MSIVVTEHAIERYAERIMDIDPATLTHAERNAIADAIRRIVTPRICAGVATLKTADAVFALRHDKVVTVKPRRRPLNWRTYKGRCRQRPGDHA